MRVFKHTYFKYFLLLILVFKAASYVVENTALCLDQDVISHLDFNDLENNGDNEKEIEEVQKITAHISSYIFSKDDVNLNNHFKIHKNYVTQFLEFTTPPPEQV